MTVTATFTVAQLLSLPGEAVIQIVILGQTPAGFIRAAYEAEGTGKARWVVLTTLRHLLN